MGQQNESKDVKLSWVCRVYCVT